MTALGRIYRPGNGGDARDFLSFRVENLGGKWKGGQV